MPPMIAPNAAVQLQVRSAPGVEPPVVDVSLDTDEFDARVRQAYLAKTDPPADPLAYHTLTTFMLREALAAPVEGIDAIAAAQKLAHDFGGVLFDEFAPTGQQDDAAFAGPGSRDVPAGIAQPGTIGLKEAVTVGRHVSSA